MQVEARALPPAGLSGLGAVDVVRGDPVRVIGGGGRNGRAGALLGLGLGALRGSLLTGLAALALLGEVGSDPDRVEEVDDASKAGQEEEVQEDTKEKAIVSQLAHSPNSKGHLHLGVEDAGLGLHHAHGAIEGLKGEGLTLAVRDDDSEMQTEILRVHLSGEVVADALLLTRRNLNAIPRSRQVADSLALLLEIPQATPDQLHGNGVGLVVLDVDQRLGWTTVDELDTEDLRGREGSLRLDGDIPSLCLRGLLGILLTNNARISKLSFPSASKHASKKRKTSSGSEDLTAAKPTPAKAWRERRARERNPKRVILKDTRKWKSRRG